MRYLLLNYLAVMLMRMLLSFSASVDGHGLASVDGSNSNQLSLILIIQVTSR